MVVVFFILHLILHTKRVVRDKESNTVPVEDMQSFPLIIKALGYITTT